jgi:ribosome-associated protein
VIIDGFVVCSAPSERQVSSIAEHLQSRLKEERESIRHIEGESTNQWVLIDTGDIVIHVFLDRVREFYNLEKLWIHGQPVLIDNSNSPVSNEMV